jgi:hypothetical protein
MVPSSNDTITGRFSKTSSVARRSAAATSSREMDSASRSSDEDSAPKCTLTVCRENSSASTAESRCCPVCCCM